MGYSFRHNLKHCFTKLRQCHGFSSIYLYVPWKARISKLSREKRRRTKMEAADWKFLHLCAVLPPFLHIQCSFTRHYHQMFKIRTRILRICAWRLFDIHRVCGTSLHQYQTQANPRHCEIHWKPLQQSWQNHHTGVQLPMQGSLHFAGWSDKLCNISECFGNISATLSKGRGHSSNGLSNRVSRPKTTLSSFLASNGWI